MFRSLRMKLVLIMVLLIISLMAVVGAFLINSVSSYYINDFYSQMQEVFADEDLYTDLTTPAEEETDSVTALKRVLDAYAGTMGVDGRNRNYYILDGITGKYLAGSDDEGGPLLDKTPNLLSALTQGEIGDNSDITATYMDVAVPISRSGQDYIVYLHDNRATIQTLNSQLMVLIIQALVFGLVISVLLSFLLAKAMITPIERLTTGARQVAGGDFSNKLEVGSKDEIGVLTNTFNNMARQLQETIFEVENERNKLDTLFQHMTDGVMAFSADGAIIQKNAAAEEMLGLSIDDDAHYNDLFSDIAPLGEVLAVEQPKNMWPVSGSRTAAAWISSWPPLTRRVWAAFWC